MQRWYRLAVLTLLVLSGAEVTKSWAQSAAIDRQAELERRLGALEQKLNQLEKRVDAALPNGAAPQTTVPEDRLDALDKKLQLIEKNNQENAKKVPVVTAGRDGFAITSADKNYRLKIGGYAQVDGKTFYEDRAHKLTNSFGLTRVRLNIDGRIGKFIEFRMAPDFGNNTFRLFDAYVDLKYQPYAILRGGKFKTPFGLEMLQPDTDLSLIERSLASDLVPNRDVGFQVSGNVAGRFTYQAAILNGTMDSASSEIDVNDGKEVVGRIFASPFAKSGPNFLQGLGFGLAASTGRQNGTTTTSNAVVSVSTAALPSFKSSGAQAVFFSYNSNAFAAGRRLRYSPQMYYYNGPFGLLAEYVESNQDVAAVVSNRVVAPREISNHAWQVAGSWVLTGEKKSYNGLLPRRPLEGGITKPGFGAWEIAGRYSELNVDPTVFTANLADSTKSARAARAWTVGLSWYLNKNARISLNYEQAHFQGGAAGGNRPAEKTFGQRLQIVF
ncbi:MAG: OprO/OprP family phosphate-selective porin [Terriglobales bacterium]